MPWKKWSQEEDRMQRVRSNASSATLWFFKPKTLSRYTLSWDMGWFPCGRTPYPVQRPCRGQRLVHATLCHVLTYSASQYFHPPFPPIFFSAHQRQRRLKLANTTIYRVHLLLSKQSFIILLESILLCTRCYTNLWRESRDERPGVCSPAYCCLTR